MFSASSIPPMQPSSPSSCALAPSVDPAVGRTVSNLSMVGRDRGGRTRRWAGVGLLMIAATFGTVAAEPPALFVRACAPCHGKDGKANTPQGRKLGVKDMTRSTLEEKQLRQQILEGKKGEDGTLKMPGFQSTLKPEEIELLARYAKSLQRPVPAK